MVLTAVLATGLGLTVAIAMLMGRPTPLATGPDVHAPVSEVLVHRFIDRSQRFRRNGAIGGVAAMLSYLVFSSSTGESAIDLDLLVLASIGLSGSICGSILAEGFRVRRRGPRIASLEVRDPDTYRDRTADRRERVLLVFAAAGVVGVVITGQHPERVAALGGLVVAIALVRRWVVHRIALRPRPVVPVEVEAADDEVRRLATSAGISRPMVTLGALTVSAQWSAAVASGPDLAGFSEVVSVVAWLGSVGLFVMACAWWWTNRSFGLTPDHRGMAGGPRSQLTCWVLGTGAVCLASVVLLVLARSTG